MAGVVDQLATGFHVPDLDGAVLAGGGQFAAVGAEGDALDPVGMAQPAVAEDAGDVGRRPPGRAGRCQRARRK